jgi:hypothetical protein
MQARYSVSVASDKAQNRDDEPSARGATARNDDRVHLTYLPHDPFAPRLLDHRSAYVGNPFD